MRPPCPGDRQSPSRCWASGVEDQVLLFRSCQSLCSRRVDADDRGDARTSPRCQEFRLLGCRLISKQEGTNST